MMSSNSGDELWWVLPLIRQVSGERNGDVSGSRRYEKAQHMERLTVYAWSLSYGNYPNLGMFVELETRLRYLCVCDIPNDDY